MGCDRAYFVSQKMAGINARTEQIINDESFKMDKRPDGMS